MTPDDLTDRPPRCWRQGLLGGVEFWRCPENAVPGSPFCAKHLIDHETRKDHHR